tara:strand:+ start:1645 stop:2049 length:405 start_codon:yes stop_codon:yes gene_type:complete
MSKRQGISPAVPLVYDKTDGPYRLNKTLKDAIKQNFKNLILTSPGERVMLPDFGVGLNNYLFEQMGSGVFDELVTRIKEQTNFYIPSINLESIDFLTSDEIATMAFNEVQVIIKYNILPLDAQDQLVITSVMTT